MKLMSNNHSVFAIYFHLILVIKYRKRVINEQISERLKQIFRNIESSYNITLEEWNHDIDHVRILFRSEPNSNISKFINAYKSASSRLIKKEYPSIKSRLYKEAFWSQSFCLISTGEADI
jgi:putative transposase